LRRVPLTVRARVLVRSLLIQASWNPRTMVGHGFAFALEPVLRWCHGPDGDDAATVRHLEPFNTHPYLATMGLGAVARMEVDGRDTDRIRRFKTAVRGPLGAIGDNLVWVGWVPALSLAALVLVVLDVPGLVVVPIFLVVYNAGHGFLRIWGWSAGYAKGEGVAQAIRDAGLQKKAQRLTRVGGLLIGCLMGVVLSATWGVGAGSPWDATPLWALGAGAVLFLAGNRARRRGWRPSLSLTAAVIGAIALVGTVLGGGT